MSGVEVVAAVSAVVSAFHGGSELLKHIKAKRLRTRQALKEFEERQLQNSLIAGEQQIGSRYEQDVNEFGHLMRIGDAIAQNRLQHITIMMQAEVIKTLQMAAQSDRAILNLTLLHEASITNKRDTIVTLDELKQRLSIQRSIPRQIEAMPQSFSGRESFAASNSFDRSTTVTEEYSPKAAIDAGTPNFNFSTYFQTNKDRTPSTHTTLPSPMDMNSNSGLQRLPRTGYAQDGSIIMQDIDHIIDSYQGLHIDYNSNVMWGGNGGRQSVDRQHLDHPAVQADNISELEGQTNNMSSLPQNLTYGARQQEPINQQSYTAYRPTSYSAYQEQQAWDPHYAAPNPLPQIQTRYSTGYLSSRSMSSSSHSDANFSNRNSSASSQDSQAPSSPQNRNHYTEYPQATFDANASPTQPGWVYSPSITSPSSNGLPHAIAPLSPQRMRDSSVSPLFSGSTVPYSPDTFSTLEKVERGTGSSGLTPNQAYHGQLYSHQEVTGSMMHPVLVQYNTNAEANFSQPQNQTAFKAPGPNQSRNDQAGRVVPGPSVTVPALGVAAPSGTVRKPSVAHSVASSKSTSSGSMRFSIRRQSKNIRVDSVESVPAGSEKMMEGRPCKDNNYWGFCKGSWTTREDVKKGLALRIQPSGMYNSKEIWECKECAFQGPTFSAPHPTKKNKTIKIIDPRIVTSQSGIRYKWIFLAKSHVKKGRQDSHTEESNYGCIICSVEDKVSSIYGGVETLMNHIMLCHAEDMSEKTKRKVACVVGPVPEGEMGWELNIPAPVQIGELDG